MKKGDIYLLKNGSYEIIKKVQKDGFYQSQILDPNELLNYKYCIGLIKNHEEYVETKVEEA